MFFVSLSHIAYGAYGYKPALYMVTVLHVFGILIYVEGDQ